MTMPSMESLLDQYRQSIQPRFLNQIARELGWRGKKCLYMPRVVLWLMIGQRLQTPGTLANAVSRLVHGGLSCLVRRGCRRRASRLSARTGAYCRARQRMPVEMIRGVTAQLTAELEKKWEPSPEGLPIYLIDGTSLQLQNEEELVASYPPARNQYRRCHWPVMRLVVLHNARSGLALQPAWGPMFGAQAVSEQALGERLLEQVPSGGVVLGDRNFGIFAMAYRAAQKQRHVVLRLQKNRALKLADRLVPGSDLPVIWYASDWDRRMHPQLPVDAQISGRLLICFRPGWREPLYLFTTLTLPADQVVKMYGLRWNVETDLRSLKRTVHLHRLTAKSEDMFSKELWAGIAAYNLVRAVMWAAARQANLDPRQLSFSQVLYLVEAFLPDLLDDLAAAKVQRSLRRLIRSAADCTLPRRSKHRSYPRAVWAPGFRYNNRREPAEKSK
jgi:DDE family transposase